jgi:hypothetical protein
MCHGQALVRRPRTLVIPASKASRPCLYDRAMPSQWQVLAASRQELFNPRAQVSNSVGIAHHRQTPDGNAHGEQLLHLPTQPHAL